MLVKVKVILARSAKLKQMKGPLLPQVADCTKDNRKRHKHVFFSYFLCLAKGSLEFADDFVLKVQRFLTPTCNDCWCINGSIQQKDKIK